MVPGINVNHKDNDGSTALMSCSNKVVLLNSLLSCRDINVNIQNNDGWTGLHRVCYWGYEACVKELLLDARINTSIRDNQGKTARDIAIRDRHLGIANMIKRTGRTSLLRIQNNTLLYDIVRMIIEEY